MTTAKQPSDSLLAAMTKARIPVANHDFIRQVTAGIGVAEYHAVSRSDQPYVRASRRDGLPDLHIYYGYTNGFTSEEEIVRVAGSGAERTPSSRKGTWTWRTRRTGYTRAASAHAMFAATLTSATAACSCR